MHAEMSIGPADPRVGSRFL